MSSPLRADGTPVCIIGALLFGFGAHTAELAAQPSSKVNAQPRLTLEQCLSTALSNNHRRPASQFGVAMAEAQHRQAMAAYWPQASFRGGYQRYDEPLNFSFPASGMQIPSQSITIPGGSAVVNIPAGAFGPGFPPSNIQMPVSFPGQSINTPAQTFAVPEQKGKVLDRDLVMGAAEMKWLLFDGGMRKGYRQQSGGLVEMMRQEARRTDLEIADTVKRFYWGAVLARQLRQLGEDTLARMEVTLRLTESLYKEGSGKVTKADYLDNLMMVDSLLATVAHLEKNEKMAQTALANTMGMRWDASVEPSASELPFNAYQGDLQDLVGSAYRFSPDWLKLEAGLRAAEAAVQTAKSGYYPKVALTGELHRWWNNGYRAGVATDQNRAGWIVGLGVEVPVFNGFLTHHKIAETRARVNELKETQFLLREGLGLQVKDLVLGLEAARKADQATLRAMRSAQDNRDLNTRAYENGLVETDKVIRAQLVEALMSAQHYMARYQYTELLSRLSLVIGTEVQLRMQGR
ncbi:MAG: TolC family protein [Bryobacterales bacterium]|nr:TolC family protein [Bryobacterales bacterium]